MHRRVQLTRRPTLTVGTVEFIGHVNFAEGVWIGVELDRRVGKNDGSVDGHRYFVSSPNRGVFVRPEDISLVV
ncbi:CAP Gly-rich domain-containing protein [Parasitella parasitica]|nr:CAP Gly-rich domain-containing protein [Parasitella parasitica]